MSQALYSVHWIRNHYGCMNHEFQREYRVVTKAVNLRNSTKSGDLDYYNDSYWDFTNTSQFTTLIGPLISLN